MVFAQQCFQVSQAFDNGHCLRLLISSSVIFVDFAMGFGDTVRS